MQSEKKPLITVITATYNSLDIIERCINSVLSQTYKNVEHVIVDGASKDGTVDILKKYSSETTKWISEPDTGVYDAWNKGIDLSKGDWILFIGADDALYEDAIENYVEYLNNNDNTYDFVSSRIHITNSKNKVIRTLGWAWDWRSSRKRNNIAHPGSFHSKSLFAKYGKYNTEYGIVGDYELLLRGRDEMKAGFMDKVTVRMEVGGISDSYRVYLETYKAITRTGKLNKIVAGLDILKEYSKFLIRRAFRSVGINIALKK
ncbi:glycosyltransferase family 2 protein [Mucilaginibacter endophyticus]|uniref:glycosyltransferase family 2 protein n=1 Tax=Mucilaginibacter endophyticus TaxID=2675003 RepID=UPI000E0CDD1B|nr:glycosyltransferase family 2 protein [Mucilaginibacter endophyticus]